MNPPLVPTCVGEAGKGISRNDESSAFGKEFMDALPQARYVLQAGRSYDWLVKAGESENFGKSEVFTRNGGQPLPLSRNGL